MTAVPEVVEVARVGDASALAWPVEPHRRELHVHCYRMLSRARRSS